MNIRHIKFTCVLLLCLTFYVLLTLALPTIAANDGHYQYSGRIDFSQPGKAYLSWPGSSITMGVGGTKFTLVMADDKGRNFYNVIFNG
ncbi:MAG: hypothetical protein ACI9C4_002891 [Paraglaciecola sp.]|jgi:hypothetical protein